MPNPTNCNPCCSTATTTQIPGPAGTDATVLPPIVGSPEGSLVGTPGQTVLNSVDDSFWLKKTGTGNIGWLQLIGVWIILFWAMSAWALPPILRGPFTTNTPLDSLTLATNIADARIAVDTTKMPASAAITNLAEGNGSVIASNLPPSALSGQKFTGVITNLGLSLTNYTVYTNGIISTNMIHP